MEHRDGLTKIIIMATVDRDSPVPAYYQLKQILKEQIQNGDLSPGDKIPTEEALCERYHLSRTPVRQALKELVVEGLLTRRAGRGTFVTQAASADESATVTLRVAVPRAAEVIAAMTGLPLK